MDLVKSLNFEYGTKGDYSGVVPRIHNKHKSNLTYNLQLVKPLIFTDSELFHSRINTRGSLIACIYVW